MKYYKLSDFEGIEVVLKPIAHRYRNNDVLAIELLTEDDEYFVFLTVNLNDSLSGNKKTNSFVDTNNCDWAERFIEENKLGKKTGNYGFSGFCCYPEYEFDLRKLNKEE